MAKQRSWDELVAAGRAAVVQEGAAQWALGDLGLEIAPIRKGHGMSAETKKFAAEVGIAHNTLAKYRSTASRWPVAKRRSAISYTVHETLRLAPARFELIRTLEARAQKEGRGVGVNDARRAIGRAEIRTVTVAAHERRSPGTVKPAPVASIGKPIDTAKRIVDNLKPGQIGELIEYAWSVLEGRQAA